MPFEPHPQTFGGFTLFDPRKIRDYRLRFRRDAIPELELANSLYVPGGRHPARGWLLVLASDLNSIVPPDSTGIFGVTFKLTIDECMPGSTPLVLNNLAIVQARCIAAGVVVAEVADDNSLYLLEITDTRGVLSNRWFKQGMNKYYNVIAPAYQGTSIDDVTSYYVDSINGATPWTWDYMVKDIWQEMPLLGTYPGLPFGPLSRPQNWIFPGVSAWDGLCDVLDHLGCSVAVDLTNQTSYAIVRHGDDDAAFDTLQQSYAGRLEDDLAWIDVGSGRAPATVTVNFHQRYKSCGQEETVTRTAHQWLTNAIYQVDVTAPNDFTDAFGDHFIWDDFPVRLDVDGFPIGADVTTAMAIATERVDQYYRKIYWETLGYLDQTYTGCLPFKTGRQVNGVCWKQDFREQRAGWRTQIVRHKYPQWKELEV